MKHFLLFFLFTLSLQAQFQINGIVKDSHSGKPLPFATITTNSGSSISDVDGKFSINFDSKTTFSSFYVSYLGYQIKKNRLSKRNFFLHRFFDSANSRSKRSKNSK